MLENPLVPRIKLAFKESTSEDLPVPQHLDDPADH